MHNTAVPQYSNTSTMLTHDSNQRPFPILLTSCPGLLRIPGSNTVLTARRSILLGQYYIGHGEERARASRQWLSLRGGHRVNIGSRSRREAVVFDSGRRSDGSHKRVCVTGLECPHHSGCSERRVPRCSRINHYFHS